MAEETIEKKTEKVKKHRFRKGTRSFFLIFLILFFILIVGLGAVDFIFETSGLPESACIILQEKLRANGISIQARRIYAGGVRGIRMEDARITFLESGVVLNAPELKFDFKPSRIFQGIFLPFTLSIQRSKLTIPMLPEFGEEAKNDQIVFTDISAEMEGMPGNILIRKAQAQVGRIVLNCTGTVDNLLHTSMSNRIQSMIKNETVAKKHKYSPAVPLEIRQMLLQVLDGIKFSDDTSRIICNADFHADLRSFLSTSANLEIIVPAIRFNNIYIAHAEEQITLQSGKIFLKKLDFILQDGSSFHAEGICSENGKSFSGLLSGECDPKNAFLFSAHPLLQDTMRHLDFNGTRLKFKGVLDHYNADSDSFGGSLDITFPAISVDGFPLKNTQIQLGVKDKLITGKLIHAELPNDSFIQGKFEVNAPEYSFELAGEASRDTVLSVLSKESAALILAHSELLPEGSRKIKFSGTAGGDNWDASGLSGNFCITLPPFSVEGMEIMEMTADAGFSGSTLDFRNIHAVMKDKTELSGEILCEPGKSLIAKVFCSGRTTNFLKNIEKISGNTTFSTELQLPENGDLLEANLEFFTSLSGPPFRQIRGSIACKNFSFRDIHFNYGAATFFSPEPDKILLQDIELESDKGNLSAKGIFSAKENSIDFHLRSSLVGNDLIRLFYPPWVAESISFPYPLKVEAKGMINYANPEKSVFAADLINGSCEWVGTDITKINTTIYLENNEISFRNAQGILHNGSLKMDYRYHLISEKGHFHQVLTAANLAELVKAFKISDILGTGDSCEGQFSCETDSDFYYENGNDLRLNGNGKFNITGNNLWSIPLLGQFFDYIEKAWPMINIGSIKEINADYEFKKDHFHMTNMQSNGGFAALKGNGVFYWLSGKYDFDLSAELLKDALPFGVIPKLLTPVSWILKKNFSGNYLTEDNQENEQRKNE